MNDKTPDFTPLLNNLADMIKEEQLKLGYMRETIRLYYPLRSLCVLLKADASEEEMDRILSHLASSGDNMLGDIGVTRNGDRYCFSVPPEGGEYVHLHMKNTEFLEEFIGTIGRHGITMDDVMAVFRKYSDNVSVERSGTDEFDYVVSFDNGIPDSYYYCIKDEGAHITYHRFTKEDYEEMI